MNFFSVILREAHLVYMLPAVFSGLSSVFSVFLNKKINLFFLIVFSISIVFIVGLRWYSGADFEGYVDMYNTYPSLGVLFDAGFSSYYGEPGYILVNIFAKHLGLFVGFLFMLFAFSSILLKSIYFYRSCINPALVFCLYLSFNFITVEFIQIRWAVATSLITYGLIVKRENNLVRIMIILMAASFQYYSLAFLPLIFIKDTCSRLSAAMYSMFGLMVAALSFAFNIPIIFLNMLTLINADGMYIYERVVSYLTRAELSVGFFSYAKIFCYFICFVFLVPMGRVEPNVKLSTLDILLYKYSILLMSLSLIMSSVPVFFYRTMVLVDLFALVFIVNSIYKIKDLFFRLAVMCGVMFAGGVWYLLDLSNNLIYGGLFEYKTWLGSVF